MCSAAVHAEAQEREVRDLRGEQAGSRELLPPRQRPSDGECQAVKEKRW